MPLVSAIISAYKSAPYIGQTLRSVFAQTFADYDVIVVNDGSPDTDELERVLQPFQGRISYIKQENRGLSAARNAGIRASQSTLIALLDSNTLWEPEYLSVQVAEMMRDPTIDVLYPNALIFGNSYVNGLEFMDLCPSEGEVTFERLITERCTVMASALVRRAAVLNAGMFDESLEMNEDFDLWLRIVKRGGRIAYHRRILVNYHHRAEKLLSNSIRSCEGILKVLDKVQQTMSLSPSEKTTLNQSRAYIHNRLQYYKGKKAFLHGDAKAAIENWKNANKISRNRKLDLAIGLLQIAPKFVLRVYQLRDRILYRSP